MGPYRPGNTDAVEIRKSGEKRNVRTMMIERRKFTRYLVQADTYAAFGPQFAKVGKTKDISIGGLAFEYINNIESVDQHPSRVSIFLTEGNFFLWNVPCRVIYDVPREAVHGDPYTASLYNYHVCGLAFETFRQDQKQSLEFFLANHTTGIVPASQPLKNRLRPG